MSVKRYGAMHERFKLFCQLANVEELLESSAPSKQHHLDDSGDYKASSIPI
jgi:hypothetical protein